MILGQGNQTPLQEGQAVTWFHTMRGGYGYVERVPAVVWRIGNKRVTILVKDNDGNPLRRSVSPENLVPKPVLYD